MTARTKQEPPIYRFRVRLLGGNYRRTRKHIWREIEIAANQSLGDLGEWIPAAFDFDNDHLWSFFLSGKKWDEDSEYAFDPFGERDVSAHTVLIRDVPFRGPNGADEFLYLFDYGDEWTFGVTLVDKSDTIPPKTRYPRISAEHGTPPDQYPELEDEDEDEDGDEDE